MKTYPGQEPALRGQRMGSIPERLQAGELRPHDGRVGRRRGRIVAPGHVHVDVAIALVGEVLLELLERFGRLHVRHQPQVELGDRLVREDGLSARAGVAADQPLDVDRGLRHEPFERLDEPDVVDPVRDAHRLLEHSLVEPPRSLGDHRLLGRGDRADVLGVSLDGGRVAVGRDERVEPLHEMPGGAVHARLVARVDVQPRAAAPPLAARGQLDLDDALGPESHRDVAVQALCRGGHEDAGAFRQRRLDIGPVDDLRKVRRADFLLALGHENQVDRQLAVGAPVGVEGREERGFRPLLVDGAAADDRPCRSRACPRSPRPRGERTTRPGPPA